VVGAILLDSDVEQCRQCVLGWFDARLQALSTGTVDKDAKTELQEYLQGRSNPLPIYDLLSVQGEDHSQEFKVACRLRNPKLVVEGSGSSRRKAEQDAATVALKRLFNHDL
jgi:ribonuclease-3